MGDNTQPWEARPRVAAERSAAASEEAHRLHAALTPVIEAAIRTGDFSRATAPQEAWYAAHKAMVVAGDEFQAVLAEREPG